MTVLLSSHILAEVQQVCSSVTIIGNGRMLASGKVDDLIGASTSYRVRVADQDGHRATPYAVSRRPASPSTPTGTPSASRPTGRREDITRTLAEAQVWLGELTPLRADLETVFLELTSGEALGEESSR